MRLLVDFIMALREGQGPPIGKDVVILGGGAAALEAASACIQGGSETVHLVFRVSREHFASLESDLRKAEDEGIRLYFESAVTGLRGKGNQLTHAQIARLSGERGEESAEEGIQVDTLLIGAGRFPELMFVRRDSEETEEPAPWATMSPYPSPSAEEDLGIFRPGEAMSDYKAVVEAIGAGRRAAASIHSFLSEEPVEAPGNMIRKDTQVLNLEELEPVEESPRQNMPESPAEERVADPSREIELGYSEDQALAEAERCLQCGLICYRRVRGYLH
jgi:NADPH-dependent glutamate synthase beta subunit-like oxidoreductase